MLELLNASTTGNPFWGHMKLVRGGILGALKGVEYMNYTG